MGHRPHLYLVPPWKDDALPLDGGARHHMSKVLRLRPGASVDYTDGCGRVGTGTYVDGAVQRGAEIDVDRPVPLVTLAVAPPRAGDRVRFAVEKLGELGVAELTWIRTARTEGRPPNDRRAAAWAIAALEQSRGAYLMACSARELTEVLDRPGVVVADPGGTAGLGAFSGASTIVIGPEGGWDPAEIPATVPRVWLGPTVLRTETAAVVAAARRLSAGAAAGD